MKQLWRLGWKMAILAGLTVLVALPANIINGSVSCPGAGTNKAISTTVNKVTWVQFAAPTGNQGAIYLGSSTVTTSSPNAAFISQGGSWLWPAVTNTQAYSLSGIFMACANSADTLLYTAIQ